MAISGSQSGSTSVSVQHGDIANITRYQTFYYHIRSYLGHLLGSKINSLKEKSDHIGNLREHQGRLRESPPPPGSNQKCSKSHPWLGQMLRICTARSHSPPPSLIPSWTYPTMAKAKAKGWWWECATDLCYENFEFWFLGIEIHRKSWLVALGVALKPWELPNWCCIQWFQESNALIVRS